MEQDEKLDAAKVGNMFVTSVSFNWNEAQRQWDGKQHVDIPGYWKISATLGEKPSRYGNGQTMSINVEQGIGKKLAEVLLPVIVADASRKAQQLADESKAMLAALGERAVCCITNMPEEKEG